MAISALLERGAIILSLNPFLHLNFLKVFPMCVREIIFRATLVGSKVVEFPTETLLNKVNSAHTNMKKFYHRTLNCLVEFEYEDTRP